MIFYLTFNDAPSGIYSSQVIDVVKFIRYQLNKEVRLVAFISLRGFKGNRKKIKRECTDAIVLPMIPGVSRWRKNSVLLNALCVIKKPHMIIGRSVLATQLAFKTGIKKIVYDGRGAIAAEWKEYNVITDPKMITEIDELEREAILNSNFRIAVSYQLANFWKKEFNYSQNEHVVIPCTLNKAFEQIEITEQTVSSARQKLRFQKQNIVFAYAGSLAGWQSFDLLYKFMAPQLKSNPNLKLLFLAEADKNIQNIMNEFSEQVFCKKVSPEEVPAYLLAADYGLLIREQSITNKVASPVKFAEYLACGLKVIISEELGDYSEFVANKNCGSLISDFIIKSVQMDEKRRLNGLAKEHFTKECFTSLYQKVLK